MCPTVPQHREGRLEDFSDEVDDPIDFSARDFEDAIANPSP